MKRKKKSKLVKKICNSPIDYFSDLLIFVSVSFWIVITIIMTFFAIYATTKNADSSVWQTVFEMVALPLTGGVFAWMWKSKEQHIVAYKNGKKVPKDFKEEIDNVSID